MNDRRRTALRTVLLLAAIAALPAATARAACRDGENALADERALATFRADLETSCPCDAYDGSSGHGRRDYRTCAAGVLAQAQSDGTLEDRCVATASDAIEGSVCGTRGVACATVAHATPRVPHVEPSTTSFAVATQRSSSLPSDCACASTPAAHVR